MQICPGTCSSVGSNFSQTHIQRPGLLYVPKSLGNGHLADDSVYIAFSMIDGAGTPYPNGMVFGYDAKNVANTIGPFETSVGGQLGHDGGGIWMGGAGLAFGPDGPSGSGTKKWIYLTTGNGTYDASSNWGDSFIKLDPDTLAIPSTNGYFTPNDEQWRGDDVNCNGPNGNDFDFGSGGVMLIPDNELAHTNWGYLAVNGEKEGDLWFIRRDVPGGFTGSTTGCLTTQGGPDVQTYATPGNNIIHNTLAFWERPIRGTDTEAHYIYVAPLSSDAIYQFALCANAGDSNPICGTTYQTANMTHATNRKSWGITPTISAASATDTDAILWVIEKTDYSCPQSDPAICPNYTNPHGILYAFDAVNMGSPLYNSSGCPSGRDVINQATKYSVPTVANGYVYLGTQSPNSSQNKGQGAFYIFGPNATGTCYRAESGRDSRGGEQSWNGPHRNLKRSA